jgi:hypothetical protein
MIRKIIAKTNEFHSTKIANYQQFLLVDQRSMSMSLVNQQIGFIQAKGPSQDVDGLPS